MGTSIDEITVRPTESPRSLPSEGTRERAKGRYRGELSPTTRTSCAIIYRPYLRPANCLFKHNKTAVPPFNLRRALFRVRAPFRFPSALRHSALSRSLHAPLINVSASSPPAPSLRNALSSSTLILPPIAPSSCSFSHPSTFACLPPFSSITSTLGMMILRERKKLSYVFTSVITNPRYQWLTTAFRRWENKSFLRVS